MHSPLIIRNAANIGFIPILKFLAMDCQGINLLLAAKDPASRMAPCLSVYLIVYEEMVPSQIDNNKQLVSSPNQRTTEKQVQMYANFKRQNLFCFEKAI